MALRTNSKQAKANIKKYIIENYDGTNYELPETDNFSEISKNILETFRAEYRNPWEKAHRSEQQSFREYAAGLPSIIDTCYFYNRSAVEDLAKILEETPEEAAKYTEDKAEDLLTYLIYRELINAERS